MRSSTRTCRSCGAARSCWPACGCWRGPATGTACSKSNTLYPLLRRLEKQGHLTSEWNTDEARPRKFYRTSATGHTLARSLTAEFRSIADAIAALPEED